MDIDVHPELISSRFAYVSLSRGSHEAQIYTNNAATLGEKLSHDVTKTSAVDFTRAPDNSLHHGVEQEKQVGGGLRVSL